MPSISVQNCLECSISKQKLWGLANLAKSTLDISSQETSLSVLKGISHSPSDPGLQGHSPSLSRAPEISPQTHGALLVSKLDQGSLKSSPSAQDSEGASTSVQRT